MLGIPGKYVNITKAIYEKAQTTLSFKGKRVSVSSDRKIQGSPLLSNIILLW